jgi:ComF family protein
MPPVLRRAGVAAALKMVSYSKERNTTAKRCIVYMKRKNTRAVFDFFSGQMAELLCVYLNETYTSPKDVLITYLPRGHKNAVKSGVDQSELLAKGIGRALGCDVQELLIRTKRREKEQKHLSKKERLENMKGAFTLKQTDISKINKTYRCIAVVDDVMTTGASLASCSAELKKGFGGRIICVCLAESEKN